MATSPFYVVFVPGITGTSLTKTGNVFDVWWEQVAKAALGKDDQKIIELLTQSGLEPGQPLQQAGTTQVYGTLIDYFTNSHQYQYVVSNGSPFSLPEQGNVLIGFGYDWRLSNTDSARQLDDLLTLIGTAQPSAPIWLLAHSMGGLISRYTLESGAFGTPKYKVSGLITAATPHIGVPFALSAITGQANQSALLDPSLIETLVDEPKFLSAFQLLVAPGTPFVFETSDLAFDIYDPASPVNQLLMAAAPNGFGVPAASLTAAQEFWSKLNPNNGIPYYITYGSGLSTVESFLYVPSGSTPLEQLPAQQNTSAGGGDGTVPVWSASLLAAQAFYDAGPVTHAGIVTSTAVLDQINTWLTGG